MLEPGGKPKTNRGVVAMNKDGSSTELIALFSIFLLILSGSLNLHLMAENSQLRNQFEGFKDGTQYGR
jgi:hypothetical protein